MKTWARDMYLHLDTNSTHDKEFEIQTRNFLTWIEGFKSDSFYFDGNLINQALDALLGL
jgi:hypothetical protein